MKINLSSGREIYVRVFHEHFDPPSLNVGRGYPIRAVTVVNISENGGKVISEGCSYCAVPDQFVRRNGVVRALKRAMKEALLDKEERRQVFHAVFNGGFGRKRDEAVQP